MFTEISGDRNPLHYDEAAAEASGFGEIVVQGGITSAILNAVVAEELPGPGTVFLNVDWDFEPPARPGDTITGAVEVREVREDKPITELDTTVMRQDGVVILKGTAVCYTMDTDPEQFGDDCAFSAVWLSRPDPLALIPSSDSLDPRLRPTCVSNRLVFRSTRRFRSGTIHSYSR